jgi:hypothetical protein
LASLNLSEDIVDRWNRQAISPNDCCDFYAQANPPVRFTFSGAIKAQNPPAFSYGGIGGWTGSGGGLLGLDS